MDDNNKGTVRSKVRSPNSKKEADNPKNESAKGSALRDFLSTLIILAAALVVAILMITFVFRSYQVDGPSMEPTLENNDKLLIWKLPKTWADITGHDYIPKRGDIIVFTESGLSRFGQENTKQLIKRVIGLPGDTVEVANGEYRIFNKQHPNGFDPDKTLPYAKNFADADDTTNGVFNKIKLGPNQIFVSGDNRPDSLDSRAFGPINAKQIVGQLVVRIYPINKIELF